MKALIAAWIPSPLGQRPYGPRPHSAQTNRPHGDHEAEWDPTGPRKTRPHTHTFSMSRLHSKLLAPHLWVFEHELLDIPRDLNLSQGA